MLTTYYINLLSEPGSTSDVSAHHKNIKHAPQPSRPILFSWKSDITHNYVTARTAGVP